MHLSRRQAVSSIALLLTLPAFARLAPGRAAVPTLRSSAELLEAVRKGELERVRRLLAGDASLARARDASGRSAYVLAHVHGHLAVAELLRGAGLELDVVEAVLAEDWKRVEELVRAEPELLHRAHPIGGTPLYAAALVGGEGAWRLRALGGDPDAAPASGSGFTPGRGALEAPHPSWARNGLTDMLGNGGDVNARQRGGSTVLHGAVLRRDAALVRLAIRKGADVDALDDEGRSARALAEHLGWEDGAKLLAAHREIPRDNRSSRFALDANREPIRRPDLSGVALSLQREVTGSSHFKLEKLRGFVASDARLVFSISGDDELTIEACAHVKSRPIIRFLLDHGAPLSLPTAVALGDLDAIAFWLERDPTLVHERGAHDFPLLWYAVGEDSVEVAERLAKYEVPVDQESKGTTALHRCADQDDVELARWLIEHGADTEAVGYFWERDGQTPLQVAMAEGNTRVAALLEDAGARR